MSDWPTVPVHLNHLEAMGLLMSLEVEKRERGLSEPQLEAKEKVEAAFQKLLAQLDLGRMVDRAAERVASWPTELQRAEKGGEAHDTRET